MNQLGRIRARRRDLVGEIARTRDNVSDGAARIRGWMRPVALGLTAGRLLAARKWLRLAGMALLAFTAVRKVLAKR
ncbi:MAG TPA: hypothetical protein VHA82_03525 [Ramlibacter sp.]|uniref:hypothetical protein n=1 Tax=Ramlibacter sp. TaxID=1917967 RepID=UPI002BF10F53|nr:hypothetical protein [Ramlibacter sp.]HVZ42858.1 hypothetical protein [Ramlibacter sp.]